MWGFSKRAGNELGLDSDELASERAKPSSTRLNNRAKNRARLGLIRAASQLGSSRELVQIRNCKHTRTHVGLGSGLRRGCVCLRSNGSGDWGLASNDGLQQ
ncbi:hypothetical protein GUJ93_ZPchr0002g25051 [Zizania palustris]|uniref:Uncharacterized protein n=1 Tax=Zizania palustris TaxID=103762 RepID=A0A8J5S0T8_ZIZPA|nr:hypothetical protein GUJ93_ZPchr0002g25051 [Zizania palustris]